MSELQAELEQVQAFVNEHYSGQYATRLEETRDDGSRLWKTVLHAIDSESYVFTLVRVDGTMADMTRHGGWMG
jgi:hypothetical protein